MATPRPEDFGAVPDPSAFGAVPVKEMDTVKANKSLAQSVAQNAIKAGETAIDLANPIAKIEAALNIYTGFGYGFPAYVIGGAGAAIRHFTGLSDEDPKVIAQRYSDALTYKPRTDAGQRLTETLLTPLSSLTEVSEMAGKKVADTTGSPSLAALTEASIQMLPIPILASLGRRMAGKIPTAQDINETARVMTGEVSRETTERIEPKLREVYEKTGVDPQAVYDVSRDNPTVIQDLASDNRAIPEAVRPTEHVSEGAGAPPEPPKPPEPAVAAVPPSDAQAHVLSRIVSESEPPGRSFNQWLHHIYTQYLDRSHPIAVEAGRSAPDTVGPYEVQRLTAGIAGKAKQFIEHGPFDAETYKTNAPSYKSVMDMAKDDPQGFQAYIVAKHAIEREAADKATGIDLEMAKKVVAEGAAKFEKASQARVAYKDALLDYAVKAGLVSEDARVAMREAYKAHVPFYRFFEDEAARAAGGKTPRNPIKRATGSERQIIDPVVSDIKDTFTFIALAEHNMARQQFTGLGKDFAVRVPDPVRPIKLQEKEIQKLFDEFLKVTKKTTREATDKTTTTAADGSAAPDNKVVTMTRERVKDALTARGFSDNEAEIMLKRVAMAGAKDGSKTVERIVKEIETTEYVPELDIRMDSKVATIFRAMKQPVGKDEIVVMNDGKRHVFKVDPEVAEAYNGLDAGSASLLSGMLRGTASLLRAGVTLAPDFALRNVVRDAVSSFVYAGSHPLKTARGAVSYFKEDVAYQNWLKGGGANAAMVSLDRKYMEQHIASMESETHLLSSAWNFVKSPIEALRIVSETLENVTRLGIAVDELKVAQTKSTIQALSMITREGTVDFSRHGADPFIQQWSRATAFMNPAMQGIDRMVRAFKDDPVGVTAKSFASITIPSALLWFANKDDPRWKEIQDWERDLFWVVMTDKYVFRIPKPFELGVLFGSVPERILDAYLADRPNAFKHLGKSIADVFTFNVTPTALLPPVQHMTNYSFFKDKPLVSSVMEKILPEYQYQPYTTEFTKALAHAIGAVPGMHDSSFASPIVIDNYIRGWTGTLGDYVVQGADLALRKSGVLPDPTRPTKTLAEMPVIKAFMIRNPSSSAQSIQDFYDDYHKSKVVTDTVHYLAATGDPEAMAREMKLNPAMLVKLDSIQKAIGQAHRTVILVDKNPNFSGDEKRQLIDTMYYQMIQMARAGNQTIQEVKKAVGTQTLH